MSPEAAIAEIRKFLPARPERVFAAFADAQTVSRWLTPSPEIRLEIITFDFHVGGMYRFAYHVPDGQVMTVNGIYSAIERPSKIVFSWNIEPPDEHAGIQSKVTVTITPVSDGTELHIRHESLTQVGAVERHNIGWRGALDRLSQMVAGVGT